MQDKLIKLSNGNTIPVLGLGTDDVFFVNRPKFVKNKIINRFLQAYNGRILKPYLNAKMADKFVCAIKGGYRLIDTSAAYDNEKSIGDAVRKSGVARKEMFLTTRCTNRAQYNNKVREEFMQSLHEFGTDYIDLYMFHWPVPEHFLNTWNIMESLYNDGLVKNLGFANCHRHHIEQILDICTVRPVLNQIEIHPLFTQKPLLNFCKAEGIQVEAYSPLAKNDDRLKKNCIIGTIAEKYGKSRVQVIIRWHIDNGIIPVPRSMNTQRMLDNFDVFDFRLTIDEKAAIDSININSRLRYDPDNCDFTLL